MENQTSERKSYLGIERSVEQASRWSELMIMHVLVKRASCVVFCSGVFRDFAFGVGGKVQYRVEDSSVE